MTSRDDDELIAELRRSLGSSSNADPIEVRGAIDSDEPTPATERVARVVSPAAMAIADQIMGLEAALAGRSPNAPQLLLCDAKGHAMTVERECTIGRQEGEGRLTIADGRVSRLHALISNDINGLSVSDLGSSNGTFLVRDGVTVRVGMEPVGLRGGDLVETVDGLLLAEVVEAEAEQ